MTPCPPPTCVYAALWSTEPLPALAAASGGAPTRVGVPPASPPSSVPPAHAAGLSPPAGAGMSQLRGREAAAGTGGAERACPALRGASSSPRDGGGAKGPPPCTSLAGGTSPSSTRAWHLLWGL